MGIPLTTDPTRKEGPEKDYKSGGVVVAPSSQLIFQWQTILMSHLGMRDVTNQFSRDPAGGASVRSEAGERYWGEYRAFWWESRGGAFRVFTHASPTI